MTNSGGIELVDDRRLLTQLRRLEKARPLRQGHNRHPRRLHDDLANSVAGLSYLLSAETSRGEGGFNAAVHVSDKRMDLERGYPVYIGLTLGEPVANLLGGAETVPLKFMPPLPVMEASSITSARGCCPTWRAFCRGPIRFAAPMATAWMKKASGACLK